MFGCQSVTALDFPDTLAKIIDMDTTLLSVGWWLAGALLVALAVCLLKYRQTKIALREEQTEVTNLLSQLTEANQELADVKARRKKLLSASTEGLIIIEQDFTISSANKQARRIFGKPGKDITLMGWTRQRQLHELVARTIAGEKMPSLYVNYDDLTLEANARAIKEGKEVVAVALAVHDITRVEQLSRARRDFVTNISHELRTPLASIQLLTDTLLNGGLEDEAMALDLVTKIATQVDTLSQLAQEVLDLSMIESGKVPLKMSVHPLRQVVEQQVDRFVPQAERKNLFLTVEIEENLTVLVDDRMIGRVISNLVHNAIKFTETGGVTISAQPLNSDSLPEPPQGGYWARVSVRDSGIGLAPDEVARIFERFYKVDRARNRQEAGTGLGLAIARHIVEAHGGKIWAQPDVSSGACFHFTIPIEF
ncbi:MAG: ATP-binding protein [Anaerolineae bacterium]